jgi:hypothetical protein
MSAVEALKAVQAAGVELRIDGESLVLEASAAPPAEVIHLLSRHKPDIIALLRPSQDAWTAQDRQAFFQERAGIAESCGGTVEKLRRALSGPVSSNGSNETRSARHRIGVAGAEGRTVQPTSSCPLASRERDMHGCIAVVGSRGASIGKRRRSKRQAHGIADPSGFPNDFAKNGSA